MEIISLENETCASEKMDELTSQGYQLIPCDNLRKALRGYVCVKDSDELYIQWPMFSCEYQTDQQEVSPEELIEFAKTYSVMKCDDPKILRMGFVFFDHENKMAVIKSAKLVDMRKSGKMRELVDIRDKIT